MSINYLFPPDSVEDLPAWRFVLHFEAPRLFAGRAVSRVAAALRPLEWKAITIGCPLDELTIDSSTRTLGIPIEVSEERRAQEGSLADYESDLWKVIGHVLPCGFGDLFYEAVDYVEDDEP
jgi:hypothetical protein